MKLNSTDINDPPTVDSNLLAQQEEVDRVVMCLEREREFFAALDDLGFNTTELSPGFQQPLDVSVRILPTLDDRSDKSPQKSATAPQKHVSTSLGDCLTAGAIGGLGTTVGM